MRTGGSALRFRGRAMQSLTRRELLRRGVTVVTAAVLVEWGLVGARRAPAMVVRSQGSAPLLTSDVGALSADEQLLFAALQGIVQSDSAPRIYLLGLDRTSRAWLRDAVPLATQAVAPYDLPLRF